MGLISDILKRKKERDRRAKEFKDENRMVEKFNEKKQSHWERELVKSLEEERQKCIKEALHFENRRRQAEDKLKAKQMLKFDSTLFKNKSILDEKDNFLKGGYF